MASGQHTGDREPYGVESAKRVESSVRGVAMDDSEIQETMGVRFRRVPHAADEAEVRARHESNRRGWNEGAEAYRARVDKAIGFLKGGGSSLHPIERANLARVGPLRAWCRTAIHLQCASGEDTLSL